MVARSLVAVALAVQVMTLMFAASNLSSAFIEEAHMIYFVLNCYLLAYARWRSLAIYNILVVLHHLVLTFSLPSLVWTSEAAADSAAHLVVHALIATILVGPLMWTAEQVRRMIESNEQALVLAKIAAEGAETNAAFSAPQQSEAMRRAGTVQETAGIIEGCLRSLLKNILDSAFEVGRSVADMSQDCGANTSDVDRSMDREAIDIAAVAKSAERLADSVAISRVAPMMPPPAPSAR